MSSDEPAEAPGPGSANRVVRSELSPHRDPGLDHQPILQVTGVGNGITVSCNCRLGWHGTKAVYEPIGEVTDRLDTQRLYNNPRNHRIHFMPKHEIHYRDVEGSRGTTQREDS